MAGDNYVQRAPKELGVHAACHLSALFSQHGYLIGVRSDWETKTFRHLFEPDRQFSLLRDFHEYEHDRPCPNRSDVDVDYHQRGALTMATLLKPLRGFVMF